MDNYINTVLDFLEEAGKLALDGQSKLDIKVKQDNSIVTNVDTEITSIDDLREFYDEILKDNPYNEVIRLMDEEGYDFVLGPGTPARNGIVYGPGLYCRNYKEIIEKQKADKLQKEQEQNER